MSDKLYWIAVAFVIGACLSSCQSPGGSKGNQAESDSTELRLPEGFYATLVDSALGHGRHIEVRENGDLYLRLGTAKEGNSLVALRDTNGDGRADRRVYFGGDQAGTGVKIHRDYLYFSSNHQVFRQKFKGDELVPSGERQLILTLPKQSQHAAKPLAFDDSGGFYITIGAPSNACQDPDRQAGVPGQDPCPLLDSSGGIWRFSANALEQSFADGERYATGIRHAVGIAWNKADGELYAMQHGRDQLHQFWPELYTQKESAEMPAEEFLKVSEGANFGWPYCYFDWKRNKRLLNPEYGGDADSIGRCKDFDRPLMGFPGHWAPNALTFYHDTQFPIRYRGGAFVAFHGSWNRAPYPQQGYKVAFVPFSGKKPMSGYDSFAKGFAGVDSGPDAPADAQYRPCGLAVGPDGSLYITESVEGRIWKVSHRKGEQKKREAQKDSSENDSVD